MNPVAGGGRAARQASVAHEVLKTVGPVVVVESQGYGDERRLAHAAARVGARALVVVGGDGSMSHAARGLIAESSGVPIAVVPAGTGNDLVKSLHSPVPTVQALVHRIAESIAMDRTRWIDAGEINGVPFVNVAGVGFDVAVLAHMQATAPSRWRGKSRYVVTALQQLHRYPGFSAALSPTGNARRQWLAVVFANGQWFGGAFRIAPDARLDDGQLDCVGIGPASLIERVHLFARAMIGTHVSHRLVHSDRNAEFHIACDEPPLFQADGELHRATSTVLHVRCLPRALRIIDCC